MPRPEPITGLVSGAVYRPGTRALHRTRNSSLPQCWPALHLVVL